MTIHIKENSVSGEELLKIGKLNLVSLDCPTLYAELNSNLIDVCYYKFYMYTIAYFCARLNISMPQLSLKITGYLIRKIKSL